MKTPCIMSKPFRVHLLILLTGFLFLLNCSQAQPPEIEWQHTFGGTDYDMPANIIQTADGGYLAAGTTRSSDGDVKRNFGDADGLLLKLYPNGNLQWQKNFGGKGNDEINIVVQLKNGDFLVAGDIYSVPGNYCVNHGFKDAWAMKISASGKLIWEKSYGGSLGEMFKSAFETSDGGYLFAGITWSSDGDIKANHGHSDYLVVKTDSNGDLLWQKTYGSAGVEMFFKAIQVNSNNYIIAGTTSVKAGNFKYKKEPAEIWIVKIDNCGNEIWQKTLARSKRDDISSLNATNDGGFILGIVTNSGGGDIEDGIISEKKRASLVKLNNAGSIEWNKSLVNAGVFVTPVDIFQIDNSEYIICGTTDYFDSRGKIVRNKIGFVLKQLDADLNIEWEKTFDGQRKMINCSFDKAADGSFIMLSGILSKKNTLRTHAGFEDFCIIKLSTLSPDKKLAEK